MILGLSENFALESSALSLGIVSYIPSYCFYSCFLDDLPLEGLELYFSFSFLFSFLSFLLCSHSSSVHAFFMKYLVPLNSRVRVALTKKMRLLSFDRNSASFSDNSSLCYSLIGLSYLFSPPFFVFILSCG